jgi:protein SHQ1
MLQTLAKEVRAAKIEKQVLGWDLDELEIAANEAMDRDTDSDDEDEVENMTPGLL